MKLYGLQYHGLGLFSQGIKLFTWSNTSHSALANNTGWVVEAWEKGGITHEPSPWTNHKPGTSIDVYSIDTTATPYNPRTTTEIAKRIWLEALKHLDPDGYDFRSLYGFSPFTRWLWRDDPNKFFCSHYVAYCCKRGGAPLFSNVTPQYKLYPGVLPWSPRYAFQCSVTSEKEWDAFLEGENK